MPIHGLHRDKEKSISYFLLPQNINLDGENQFLFVEHLLHVGSVIGTLVYLTSFNFQNQHCTVNKWSLEKWRSLLPVTGLECKPGFLTISQYTLHSICLSVAFSKITHYGGLVTMMWFSSDHMKKNLWKSKLMVEKLGDICF